MIAILGQTATGKSEIAIELAEKFNGEIISVDSVSIYKKLNIGAAKPNHEELARVNHHCINLVEPDFPFTASDFVEHANVAIKNIESKNKIPIFAGGTFFYYKTLKYGMWEAPSRNSAITEKWNLFCNKYGQDALYNELLEIDPKSALEISKSDRYRIQRALEIFDATGVLRSKVKESFEANKKSSLGDVKEFALILDRELLYDKVRLRTKKMIDLGLVDEVKEILNSGISKDSKSLKSIGYKEIVDFLENRFSLDETIELISKNTMRLAKQQRTWARAQKEIKIIDCKKTKKEIFEEICSLV